MEQISGCPGLRTGSGQKESRCGCKRTTWGILVWTDRGVLYLYSTRVNILAVILECGKMLLDLPVARTVKNLPAMQETWVRSLGREDPLEKGMAIHSSILAWRIPWTEEPGGAQSMVLQRVGHDWAANTTRCYCSGNWVPGPQSTWKSPLLLCIMSCNSRWINAYLKAKSLFKKLT